MQSYSDVFLNLAGNSVEVFEESTRLLLKIADNILKDPQNQKIRTLQKSNNTISNKIIKISGALECLKLMGFKENEFSLNLPLDAPLNKVKLIRDEILKLKDGPRKVALNNEADNKVVPVNNGAVAKLTNGNQTEAKSSKQLETTKPSTPKLVASAADPPIPQTVPETFKRIVLPPLVSIFQNPFLKDIERAFHFSMNYDNSYFHERARSVIPMRQLEIKAQERLHDFQYKIKKEKLKDPEAGLQEMLLIELLAWFKNDFFEWVTNPPCDKCEGPTKMHSMATDKNLLIYTDRVEMHKCTVCSALTAFPRYNDFNILLETRKGRCGEWSKTFTLLCRAMGWDARFVSEESDHCWTEVYSHNQKRWIHCDACENVCDTPLMYETGWNRKITYAIAYSAEEVQDVTWRYSAQHKQVLSRRNKCSEEELVEAIMKLREKRQSGLSDSRKDYLRKRVLNELVELMVERKPTDKEYQGRTSGSLEWRTSRGETTEKANSYVWKISKEQASKGNVSIQYSSSQDMYQLLNDGAVREISGWQNGAFSATGLFRKEEKDWKMVYLCRNEGVSVGKIVWKFEVEDDYNFNDIDLTVNHFLLEKGTIEMEVSNGRTTSIQKIGDSKLKLSEFSGTKELMITVNLSGGTQNSEWQHSQLFRQSLDSTDFPFHICFSFKQ